jgi:hypothetical protein
MIIAPSSLSPYGSIQFSSGISSPLALQAFPGICVTICHDAPVSAESAECGPALFFILPNSR